MYSLYKTNVGHKPLKKSGFNFPPVLEELVCRGRVVLPTCDQQVAPEQRCDDVMERALKYSFETDI